MNTLKIKDNVFTKKADFSTIPNLTDKIANKTLEQLDSEGIFVFPELIKNADDITKDQIILQSVNDSYRTENIMGYLGYGNERLLIQSRFQSKNNDFFLQYLIHNVLDIPNIVNLETDAGQDGALFNFLLFLFPRYLKEALRKGAFKKYTCKKYNNSNINGCIDVARHIKTNTPFVGKIAYNKREFSFNNSLTQLIRHTIEFIKKKPYGNTILARVKDEVKIIINATPDYEIYDRQKIISDNKKAPVQHAFFREYLVLQRLCLLILQNRKHGIGNGSRQIYGILFDGAWLWEEYINNLIKSNFHHPMNKSDIGAQRLFSGGVGLIYPDFISKNCEKRIIADAKYKPIKNISNRDYLQLLAYMFRFDAKCGYFLYPESSDNCDLQLKLKQGTTYENNVSDRDDIFIIKHGLKIPNESKDYEAFVFNMKKSENDFLNGITL